MTSSQLPPHPDELAARIRRLWIWCAVAAGVAVLAVVAGVFVVAKCITFFGESSPCNDGWEVLVLAALAVAVVGVVTAIVFVVRLVIAYRARSSQAPAGSPPSG